MGKQTGYRLERVDNHRWRIAKQGEMRTDGIIFSNDKLVRELRDDPCVDQVANVACLPGIVGAAMAMPDIHWGYGFPIGGVAAFDVDEGVISPGGVGYDINCGVRLLRAKLDRSELGLGGDRLFRPSLSEHRLPSMTREDACTSAPVDRFAALVNSLYERIPSGVGAARLDVKLNEWDLNKVLDEGASWVVGQGWGNARDLEHCEGGGFLREADAKLVSERARARGFEQLGTLGSGNHFCELGYVDAVYDEEAARAFGLVLDQVTVLIHTGSRGLGYQVCDDAIAQLVKASAKYKLKLPDRQLCSAPISSPEGQHYLGAMSAAANFAFANRQLIAHCVRQAFEEIFGRCPLDLVYDVAHNIAKIESHVVDGSKRRLCVHRKGATRAFPPGHAELHRDYREVGQPVLVPGDMGRYSYVLAGCEGAMTQSFGSSCHGAGRTLSRSAALKAAKGRQIARELEEAGIAVRAASRKTLDEEFPDAYKDVADVVDVVEGAGIARKVVRIRPLGVIKG